MVNLQIPIPEKLSHHGKVFSPGKKLDLPNMERSCKSLLWFWQILAIEDMAKLSTRPDLQAKFTRCLWNLTIRRRNDLQEYVLFCGRARHCRNTSWFLHCSGLYFVFWIYSVYWMYRKKLADSKTHLRIAVWTCKMIKCAFSFCKFITQFMHFIAIGCN